MVRQKAHVTLFPLMLQNSYSNFSRTDYIQLARSPLIVGVVHCMQQANVFDGGMFAVAFVFELACIPVTRLLQSTNLDVLYDV